MIEEGFLAKIILELGTLLGFAAFVSMLINVGKWIHWVRDGVIHYLIPDGSADKWVAGLNLLGVVALYITRLVVPDFQIVEIDTVLGEVALAGTYILGFVSMLIGSKITYFGTKGLPGIGTSRSTTSTAVVALSSPGQPTEVSEGTATIIDTARHPE